MAHTSILITGASSFVGCHLLAALTNEKHYQITALTRHPDLLNQYTDNASVDIVSADLINKSSLEGLVRPGCIVINLSFSKNESEEYNLSMLQNLMNCCDRNNIKRFIHISSIDVVGRVRDKNINEKIQCLPVTTYGKTKLKLEQLVLSSSLSIKDVVIYRMGAIFGENSQNLKKLANNLLTGSRLSNYFRSILYARRSMNLVHIDNVVGSIIFALEHNQSFDQNIYFVTDDDDPTNNYQDIERIFMRCFGQKNYLMPLINLPSGLLKLFLLMLDRDNIEPNRLYPPDKLYAAGYKKNMSFAQGLEVYAKWYADQKFLL